jgi:hypothetical protein
MSWPCNEVSVNRAFVSVDQKGAANQKDTKNKVELRAA